MYTILNGGYNTKHPKTFIMSRPKGLSNYVLLIIKAPCRFTIGEITRDISAGTAVIINKNTPYEYYNPYGVYTDDWLHFLVSDETGFLNSGICLNEFFPISNVNHFTTYIKQLMYENRYALESFKKANTDSLMNALFNNLICAYNMKESFSKSSIYYEQLKVLRLKLQHSPYENLTISETAKKLGISPSHFQHLYSELFGISFQKDLINMKISNRLFIRRDVDE